MNKVMGIILAVTALICIPVYSGMSCKTVEVQLAEIEAEKEVAISNEYQQIQTELFNTQQLLYSANFTISQLQARVRQLEARPVVKSQDNRQIEEVMAISYEQARVAQVERDMAVASMEQAESNYLLMTDKYNDLRAFLEDINDQTDNVTSANFTSGELASIYEWWDIQWDILEVK